MATEQPFAAFELKDYQIVFFQSDEREFGGTVANVRALVRCTGKGLQDDRDYKMDVFFLPEYSDVPDPQVNIGEGVGTLFMPMSDMPIFVDVLRNERPIYGQLRADDPQLTSITTTKEPIGAGDEDYVPEA